MLTSNIPRKMIIKDFVKTNNLPKYNFTKKYIQRNNISSIELSSPINQNIIRNDKNKKLFNKQYISIKSNNILKDNKQIIYPKINTLTKTPENNKNIYYKCIQENYSAEQKKIINFPNLSKNSENKLIKIDLTNRGKLPTILRNEYKFLNLPQKTDIKREEPLRKDLYKISSLDIGRLNNKFNEIHHRVNKDLNKNVNINIIDYNKIFVKKDSKPLKILEKVSDEDISKKLKYYRKTKLQNYRKIDFMKIQKKE